MEEKNSGLGSFLKSFIIPRQMTRRMNMRFIVALLLLIASVLLNIITSNIHVEKDVAEDLNVIPELLEVPEDFKLLNSEGEEFPVVSLVTYDNKTLNFDVNGEEVEQTFRGMGFSSDKDGVYHGVYEKNGINCDITFVIDTKAFCSLGSIKVPVSFTSFDLEGYLKQKKAENTHYALYVATFDMFYALYDLSQVENGKSTKAPNMSYIFEVDNRTRPIYYLPANESELVLNSYGDYDTTLWTRVATVDDKIDFVAPDGPAINPSTRHLKNILNSLYGSSFAYSRLDSTLTDGLEVNLARTDFNKFVNEVYNAMILDSAATVKSSSLMLSAMINILFCLIMSLVTWLISKSLYMNKYRQYFAVSAICFFDVSLIAAILGVFLKYEDFAIYVLVAGAIYFIISTFRINTIQKEDEENPSKEEVKKPITYNNSDDFDKIG